MLCTSKPPADEPLFMNIFPVMVKAFIMKSIYLKVIKMECLWEDELLVF